MTPQIKALYEQLKREGGWIVGQRAQHALRDARTIVAFRELEKAGRVRISVTPETDSYFDVFGEPETKKERDQIAESLEAHGLYCVETEVRTVEGDWITADSIGMCVYNDPKCPIENAYLPGMMQAAVELQAEHPTPSYSLDCPVARVQIYWSDTQERWAAHIETSHEDFSVSLNDAELS